MDAHKMRMISLKTVLFGMTIIYCMYGGGEVLEHDAHHEDLETCLSISWTGRKTAVSRLRKNILFVKCLHACRQGLSGRKTNHSLCSVLCIVQTIIFFLFLYKDEAKNLISISLCLPSNQEQVSLLSEAWRYVDLANEGVTDRGQSTCTAWGQERRKGNHPYECSCAQT